MSICIDRNSFLSGITSTELDGLFDRIRMKLGAPIMGVELTDDQITECFFESMEEYSTFINNWFLENRMAEMLGLPVNVDFTLKYVASTLNFEKSVAASYAEEQGYSTPMGRELKKDSIALTAGTQDYTIPGNRQLLEVLWYTPAFVSFYGLNPGASIEYTEFGASFQGLSLYSIMPVFDTVISTQAAELRNRVRSSEYAYRLKNGPSGTQVLTLYPVPTNSLSGNTGQYSYGIGTPGMVFYEYYDTIGVAGNPQFSGTNANPDPSATAATVGNGLVSSPADAQLNYLTYNMLNAPARTWIKKFTQAKAKELLGYLRGKFNGTLPIPDAELTLNSADLLANGREDQKDLLSELKETLDKLSYKNILENRSSMQDSINKTLGYGSPGIYIG